MAAKEIEANIQELIKRIEQAYGTSAVRDGFKMNAEEFYSNYIHLLKEPL